MTTVIEKINPLIIKVFNFYELIILECIELEDPETVEADLNAVYKTFRSEYVHNRNRHVDEQVLFKNWLQGLPSVLSVPYTNFDIIENAKASGMDVDTDEKQDLLISTYFEKLTSAFFTLKNILG